MSQRTERVDSSLDEVGVDRLPVSLLFNEIEYRRREFEPLLHVSEEMVLPLNECQLCVMVKASALHSPAEP